MTCPGGLRGSKVPHLGLGVVILDRSVRGHQGATGRLYGKIRKLTENTERHAFVTYIRIAISVVVTCG